jgi:hypothetical protein
VGEEEMRRGFCMSDMGVLRRSLLYDACRTIARSSMDVVQSRRTVI